MLQGLLLGNALAARKQYPDSSFAPSGDGVRREENYTNTSRPEMLQLAQSTALRQAAWFSGRIRDDAR